MRVSPEQPLPATRRLIYDRTDRTARELAERLVARGVLGPGVPAAGLTPADFASARRGNDAWAFVAAVLAAGAAAAGTYLLVLHSLGDRQLGRAVAAVRSPRDPGDGRPGLAERTGPSELPGDGRPGLAERTGTTP